VLRRLLVDRWRSRRLLSLTESHPTLSPWAAMKFWLAVAPILNFPTDTRVASSTLASSVCWLRQIESKMYLNSCQVCSDIHKMCSTYLPQNHTWQMLGLFS
jgi:hypothetical protein